MMRCWNFLRISRQGYTVREERHRAVCSRGFFLASSRELRAEQHVNPVARRIESVGREQTARSVCVYAVTPARGRRWSGEGTVGDGVGKQIGIGRIISA